MNNRKCHKGPFQKLLSGIFSVKGGGGGLPHKEVEEEFLSTNVLSYMEKETSGVQQIKKEQGMIKPLSDGWL